MADVGALLLVDRDTATARDIADDRVARDGRTTARHLREQVAGAENLSLGGRLSEARRGRVDTLRGRLTLQQRREHTRDALRADRAVTDGGEEVFDRILAEEATQLILPIGEGEAEPAQLPLDQLAPFFQVFLAGGALKPLADLLAGVRGLDKAKVLIEPVTRGAARLLAGDDLDDVTVVKGLIEGDEAAIYLRADAFVAEVRVHAVGKIE